MYPIAILAGGLATRMRPLTATVPKALLDVNGEPFIAHQLRLLAGWGVERAVICTAYLGEQIEQYVGDGRRFGLQVVYSPDGDRLLGTAGALKRALPLLGGRFLVIYGDSYLPCDARAIVQAFDHSGKLGLMTVVRNEDQWDTSNVVFESGEIITYDKKARTAAMRHIDYGLGVFQAHAFADIPTDRPSCLAELYQALLGRGELAGYEVRERFYEIGSFQGLEELCRYLQKNAPRRTA
ncbi:MAG TPA: nucleotidyltransferase family protein [Gemmataceae bacterium]|nr:nucleotidyltransferase family protein [Gemmataceae bacterium]